MRGNGRLNGKNIIVIGVIMFIIITASTSLIPIPTGNMSGGFMIDGERVPDTPLFSFADPTGGAVDAIWVEMTWTVQGEDIDWLTFHVEGSYEIRLWNIHSPTPNVLETHPFEHTGEIYASIPYNTEGMDYDLDTLLRKVDGDLQPFTNPADPTYWTLTFYGEFTATVNDNEGNVLDPIVWDGETPEFKVYWTTGTWTGSGSVSTG